MISWPRRSRPKKFRTGIRRAHRTIVGVVSYWLGDTSDGFANTHVLVDRGLDLACALLKAGVANKIFAMAVFLFKTHVLGRMELLIDPIKGAGQAKRRFMERVRDA